MPNITIRNATLVEHDRIRHASLHLAGGKMDCFSCVSFGESRAAVWRGSSFLNERHMQFAWASLISVGSADLYIRLVASGAISDLRLL